MFNFVFYFSLVLFSILVMYLNLVPTNITNLLLFFKIYIYKKKHRITKFKI